jgi:hypothetical protein
MLAFLGSATVERSMAIKNSVPMSDAVKAAAKCTKVTQKQLHQGAIYFTLQMPENAAARGTY